MSAKSFKQKIIKQRTFAISRVMACASFLVLAIIAVSSLVRAMSLEHVDNENGIPASWEVASLGNPDTITLPITYWDQRQDDCGAPDRQFEWVQCGITHSGASQGIVKDHLGSDGLPIPSYATVEESRAAGMDVTSEYVLGHDPVRTTDNFYQWFHNTSRSEAYEREVTFHRIGNNTYQYGGAGIFPLDNVAFSNGDPATSRGHNYHFTAHLKVAMKIDADGNELFEFTGDDDVWVFLNNRLVLDIGGLHEAVSGWFRINTDGTITSHVDGVGDKTFSIGISAGDIVNLDFFYAERSTTESNTKITINNMNWPISADSKLTSKIVGELGTSHNKLVQYEASVSNRDPDYPLVLERVAAYINDSVSEYDQSGDAITGVSDGFLPLDIRTLEYTYDASDKDSWQTVGITPPGNSVAGFNLDQPLTLQPDGQEGDTINFRYFAETAGRAGKLYGQINFFTSLEGATGITYDSVALTYGEKYDLTIKYVYEDDTEAGPDYTRKLEQNERYAVETPTIEGYAADHDTVTGIMPDHATLIKVVYTRAGITPSPIDPEPETPDTPEEPEPEEPTEPETPETPATPEEPELPAEPEPTIPEQPKPEESEPVAPVEPSRPKDPTPAPTEPTDVTEVPLIPESDLLDGGLVWLAPLGEVAYIPNSGVVSSAAPAVFEEQFAELVLSQWFVLAAILIFSGSFATYFSLKKHVAPASTTRVRKASAAAAKRTPAKPAKNTTTKSTKTKSVIKASAKTTKTAKAATRTKRK